MIIHAIIAMYGSPLSFNMCIMCGHIKGTAHAVCYICNTAPEGGTFDACNTFYASTHTKSYLGSAIREILPLVLYITYILQCISVSLCAVKPFYHYIRSGNYAKRVPWHRQLV